MMKEWTAKDKRRIAGRVKRLFTKNSFNVPKSIGDIPIEKYFARRLCLTESRTIFLTDSGLENFKAVVDILYLADLFDTLADYSDIWSVWRGAVENWLSLGVEPSSAEEVVTEISGLVDKQVDNYGFAVPIFGVELKDDSPLLLGNVRILKISTNYFSEIKVDAHHIDVEKMCPPEQGRLWITGSVRGTARVAERKFSDQTTLTVGVLAIAAASMYELGASKFRIGIEMKPQNVGNRVSWFSWSDTARSLTAHYASPSQQLLPVDEMLSQSSDMIAMIHRTLSIVQKDGGRTELEEAIARAVFWYSDAHRDSVLVMQFIKYWSCVEAFFSIEKDDITEAVTSGLAAQMIFGGFHFVPPNEYRKLKAEMAKFYGLRSQAMHRASHNRIAERDAARFSQLVAWLIISMVGLVTQGYTKLDEIKVETKRLDALAMKIDEHQSTGSSDAMSSAS
ncbi:HEPN domain-containing protein [Burkholderia gladioli]|uniref:HEPN domain-containing protein n=2 Tax=Burkholderia gladioli TaxID=28095 RepID=UPI00163FDD88|nr:HEPN domain-containing protein [Burkholderia gladioli]